MNDDNKTQPESPIDAAEVQTQMAIEALAQLSTNYLARLSTNYLDALTTALQTPVLFQLTLVSGAEAGQVRYVTSDTLGSDELRFSLARSLIERAQAALTNAAREANQELDLGTGELLTDEDSEAPGEGDEPEDCSTFPPRLQ